MHSTVYPIIRKNIFKRIFGTVNRNAGDSCELYFTQDQDVSVLKVFTGSKFQACWP